jgi:superfamily I DNA/RNA helicase
MIAKAREIAYDAYLLRETEASNEDGEDGTRFENLDELVQAAAKFANAAAMLDFVISQRSRAKALAADQDAVQLLTIHRSKGLEWPVVHIAGICLNLLPHKRSLEYLDVETRLHLKPECLEEERRLCYVGMTRARDELRMSCILERNDGPVEFSPFMREAGFDEPEEYKRRRNQVIAPYAVLDPEGKDGVA